MKHPNDYRLERWLAALFSLLFLLPAVADAQPLVSDTAPVPVCQDDVTVCSPTLTVDRDVKPDVFAGQFESRIRVTASERRTTCSPRS